ncbi:MAG: DUF2953 domain-containing protein [Lachnospiraceae bacterium]|nr:DUF2953 domain-containing protein [Lachnospiraceae bacterium]
MLHVGLLILKILGIILLIVLGLLLLFLYAVLFIAVSYRVRARREETFEVTASAAWLFRIFSIYFSFAEGAEENLVLQVRLFGAPVWRIWGAEKPEKRKRKSGLGKRFRKRKPRKEKQEEVKEAVPRPERKAEEPQREEPEKEAVPKVPEEPETSVSSEGSPVSEKKVRKRSFFHRLFRKAVYAVRGICDKIKQIWKKLLGIKDVFLRLLDRKKELFEFWNLEEHRRARSAFWKEMQYLWKKSRPRKIKGKIRFGFTNPAHTGLCMGAVGMLCAWYPKRLELLPDFEQKILKGEADIRGRIRCYVFVRVLLRIYFHKDIRQMYQHWKEL